MRKNEAEILKNIVCILDKYFFRIYNQNHEYGVIVHYASQEIKKLLEEE